MHDLLGPAAVHFCPLSCLTPPWRNERQTDDVQPYPNYARKFTHQRTLAHLPAVTAPGPSRYQKYVGKLWQLDRTWLPSPPPRWSTRRTVLVNSGNELDLPSPPPLATNLTALGCRHHRPGTSRWLTRVPVGKLWQRT
jgi:hypothetical protein